MYISMSPRTHLCILLSLIGVVSLEQNKVVPQCLLRCKDEHMMQMDSAEWSMDFAFPLLSLLRANSSHETVTQRILDICDLNNQLQKCLEDCPNSVEKRILFYGMDPWREICANIKGFGTQFPCWQENIDALIIGCFMESHKLRRSMELLTRNTSIHVVESVCQDLNSLSICNVMEYSKFCGQTTRALLSQLFRVSRDSMSKMLRIKWNELPSECMRRVDHGLEYNEPNLVQASEPANGALSTKAILSRFLLLNTLAIFIYFWSRRI